MLDSVSAPATGKREVVALRLGDQDFCIDIGLVREIRGWSATTMLPNAQHYIAGVMNLRGSVVAVVDLAARLGLGDTRPTPRHVVIIVSLNGQTVGLLADLVSDILAVTPDMTRPVPERVAGTTREHLACILALEDGRILRDLDLSHLLAARIAGAS